MLFILHQTNCQNAFGAGFAGYLNRTFPLAKRGYHDYVNSTLSTGDSKTALLGRFAEVKGDGFSIIHVFGQYYYGNSRKTGKCYTIYEAVERALLAFRKMYPDDTAICPVNMGCGLAGGDWNRYSKILAKYNIIPCDRIDLERRVYHKASK